MPRKKEKYQNASRNGKYGRSRPERIGSESNRRGGGDHIIFGLHGIMQILKGEKSTKR